MTKKGTTRTPCWHPEEAASLTAIASRPEAAGWHPPCDLAPLTTSLRGLWVSGSAGTGQWWTVLKGRRPKNRPSDARGLTQNSQAGNPKRTRPNCHRKEVHLNQRGLQQPKNPGVAEPLVPASCRGNCWCDSQLHCCAEVCLCCFLPET